MTLLGISWWELFSGVNVLNELIKWFLIFFVDLTTGTHAFTLSSCALLSRKFLWSTSSCFSSSVKCWPTACFTRLKRKTMLNKPFTKLSLTRLNTLYSRDLMTCHESSLSHSSWPRRASYNHTLELIEMCQRDVPFSSLHTQSCSCFLPKPDVCRLQVDSFVLRKGVTCKL